MLAVQDINMIKHGGKRAAARSSSVARVAPGSTPIAPAPTNRSRAGVSCREHVPTFMLYELLELSEVCLSFNACSGAMQLSPLAEQSRLYQQAPLSTMHAPGENIVLVCESTHTTCCIVDICLLFNTFAAAAATHTLLFVVLQVLMLSTERPMLHSQPAWRKWSAPTEAPLCRTWTRLWLS
jgi:hypothetical protein